jgi:hypothetical protein
MINRGKQIINKVHAQPDCVYTAMAVIIYDCVLGAKQVQN